LWVAGDGANLARPTLLGCFAGVATAAVVGECRFGIRGDLTYVDRSPIVGEHVAPVLARLALRLGKHEVMPVKVDRFLGAESRVVHHGEEGDQSRAGLVFGVLVSVLPHCMEQCSGLPWVDHTPPVDLVN